MYLRWVVSSGVQSMPVLCRWVPFGHWRPITALQVSRLIISIFVLILQINLKTKKKHFYQSVLTFIRRTQSRAERLVSSLISVNQRTLRERDSLSLFVLKTLPKTVCSTSLATLFDCDCLRCAILLCLCGDHHMYATNRLYQSLSSCSARLFLCSALPMHCRSRAKDSHLILTLGLTAIHRKSTVSA